MIKFYQLVIWLLMCFLGLSCESQIKNIQPTEFQVQVEKYLAPLISHDLFSGSILIIQDGEMVMESSYGLANIEHAITNTSETKFRIASLSKAFTKLAIRQITERGIISESDTIGSYLHDFRHGGQIRIEHLLNHSSGIPHLNDLENYDSLAKEHYSVSEVIELFKDLPLEYKPGSQFTYSNSGYVLLTRIIEQSTGLSYGDYLNKYIFKPAGMTNSGHDNGLDIVPNLAEGYMMNLKGKGLQHALYYDPSIKIGGGSLYSTVGDLAKFCEAFASGELSTNTEPLYDQGLFGRSPGYVSSIWGFEGHLIVVLSNNYNTPIRKMSQDLIQMVLGKEYEIVDIQTTDKPLIMSDYAGDYLFQGDIETIEQVDDILIEYENGDKWRGCRLIPIGKDKFYDCCYMEKIEFYRNEEGIVHGFKWETEEEMSTKIFEQ